jgi:hypothetical protein
MELQTVPGRLGYQPAGTMTGVRGARCNWVRRWRPCPPCLALASHEAWPELRLRDDDSLWPEPRWNAGRRARPAGCAPQRKLRRRCSASYGVPLPFSFFFGVRVLRPDCDGASHHHRTYSRGQVPKRGFVELACRMTRARRKNASRERRSIAMDIAEFCALFAMLRAGLKRRPKLSAAEYARHGTDSAAIRLIA